MKTGKNTSKFQYNSSKENQITGSSAQFPVRRLYGGIPPVAATSTLTFTGTGSIGATITLVNTAQLSRTYTVASSLDAAAREFRATSATQARDDLTTCIEASAGHNGTIITSGTSTTILTLTQAEVGKAGNTIILSSSLNVTLSPLTGSFSGGQDGRDQKYNPHAKEYVIGGGSGSFTAQIDPYRQGVSILTDNQRAQAALPTFDPKNTGIEEKYIFGQSTLSEFAWPFIEKPNMENIGATEGLFAFAQGSIATSSFVDLEYEVIQADKRYILGNILNGTAEALSSVRSAFDSKIFSRSLDPIGSDTRTGIKADIMEGNSFYMKGTSTVKPLIPMTVFGNSPFVDGCGVAGIGITGNPTSMSLASGTVFAPNRRHALGEKLYFNETYGPVPFDETDFESRMFTKAQINSLNLDADFKTALLNNVSGSTEDLIPDGFKSARTGFIFTNNGLNVDSIAFGGLRRDA